jgi:hypothetical protein
MAGKKGRSGRKPVGPRVTVSIRVDIPLHNAVEKAASGQGRTISGYVRRVLQRNLEDEREETR